MDIKHYQTWSRKGHCPGCRVGTGCKHKSNCEKRKWMIQEDIENYYLAREKDWDWQGNFNPTYWIDKIGLPSTKEYERLLEAEDKENQIFTFSWSTILFLLLVLAFVIYLIFFVT